MKKLTLVLAIMMVAATTFAQTSRRTANNTTPAGENQNRRTVNNSTTRENKSTGTTTTRRSTEVSRESGNTNVKTTNERRSTTVTNNNGNGNREIQRETTTRRTVNTGNENSKNTDTYRRNNGNSQREVHQQGNGNGNREVYRESNGNGKHSYNHVRVSANRTHYESPRQYRETHTVVHHYKNPPRSAHYRAKHYPYRRPVHVDIIWTPAMRTEYIEIYPMVRTWRYPVGYRIETISSYDAYAFPGEVMNVYGRVEEVFYAYGTDEYILYFGAYYPYHDFSVVIPGRIARMYSRWPENYYTGLYMSVTGLITVYDDRPEIVVRRSQQINAY